MPTLISRLAGDASSLPRATDGSILSISVGADGELTGVTGTSQDGVVHELHIERGKGIAVVQAVAGRPSVQMPWTSSICKFSDNGKLYFTMAFTLVSNGSSIFRAKLVTSNSTSSIDHASTLLYYDFAFHDEHATAVWHRPGHSIFHHVYDFPLRNTPFPSDWQNAEQFFPSIVQAFGDELHRTTYFDPFLTSITDEFAADAQGELQARGLSLGTIPGLQLLSLSDPRPPEGSSGSFRQALSDAAKGIWKAIGWGVAGGLVAVVSGGSALVILISVEAGYSASAFDTLISGLDGPSTGPGGGTSDSGVGTSQNSGTGNVPDDPKKKVEKPK